METLTSYQDVACQLMSDLIDHGWGEMVFRVDSLKDNKVAVKIVCGKQYMFFVRKEIKINSENYL